MNMSRIILKFHMMNIKYVTTKMQWYYSGKRFFFSFKSTDHIIVIYDWCNNFAFKLHNCVDSYGTLSTKFDFGGIVINP